MRGGAGAEDALARFDSSAGGGRSFELRGLRGVVEASRLEEVVPALAKVEAAVQDGLHAAGFVAYEAAPAFDPALSCEAPRAGLPLLWFGLFSERVEALPPSPPGGEGDEAETFELGPWTPELPYPDYAERVERVREWIAAGDTYQVNLTFRLHAAFHGSDLALYHRLCTAQRARYCALLRMGGRSLVSASPELFFRWSGGALELRPMKGTRPRGRWAEEDEAQARELIGSEKERAENLMIVDLLRNDAGRISEYGSVRVSGLFEVERYPTVHQLTSTIHSRTREGTTLTDVFRALFPCGSVTGAPKVRTMELIRALEDGPRGAYTGAIGFVSEGEAVFNVPIRTVVVDHRAGVAELGVGSGITYDSTPEAEYRECLGKAAFAERAPRAFDLLETMLHRPGEGVHLLDEHMARLSASAAYFGFPVDPGAVRRQLDAEIARAGGDRPLRVRLRLSEAGAVRVEALALDPQPGPLRARLARAPVDSRDPLLYHKTTWRAAYDSRLAEDPSCEEVLLLNERGELTEFANGNLVLRKGTDAWTPPVESGLLPGTMRAALLRSGEIRERVLHPEDLRGADAMYRINSVRGWTRAEIAGFPRSR